MNRQKNTAVNYTLIDPVKKLAQSLAKSTKNQIKVVASSRGESAFVWEEKDSYRAFVLEDLGTKNLVADEMRKITGKTYYDSLAQDTVAMIVNDLIVVGAKPEVINAYFAAGSSQWFADKKRAKDLVEGWAKACKIAEVTWGGGESPALAGIMYPKTAELAGAAIGIIKPKQRLTLGNKLRADDAIILVESSGIHANGLSLTRSIAEKLPDRYSTKLSDGLMYGETLLIPTYIYVNLVKDLFEAGIDIHYMVNITGHGFRKLMRASKDFTYQINQLPKVPPIFDFIQGNSGSSDEEMYATFNMGAGFAIFLPSSQVEKVQKIAQKNNFKSWNVGVVKKGKKQVIIEPKNIIFSGKTLNLR